MQLKYSFDGSDAQQTEIMVYTGEDYLVFEQATTSAFIDCELIQLKIKDIPDLIKALQSFIAGA